MIAMLLDLNLDHWATNKCHTLFVIKVSDRIGALINYFCMTTHLSMTVFSWVYSQDKRNMLGRIGGLSHSDQTMQFSWTRTTILFSCVKEQTEENANMLFVINTMRNIQKPRRDQEVVFSVKMSWSSLVIMNYPIYSYVLMYGGIPEITWEVPSGQNMT